MRFLLLIVLTAGFISFEDLNYPEQSRVLNHCDTEENKRSEVSQFGPISGQLAR